MPAPKTKKPRSTMPIMYETESGDTHMAGPSNRQPAMKARELDSHVRSLKRNRDGSEYTLYKMIIGPTPIANNVDSILHPDLRLNLH